MARKMDFKVVMFSVAGVVLTGVAISDAMMGETLDMIRHILLSAVFVSMAFNIQQKKIGKSIVTGMIILCSVLTVFGWIQR